MTDKTIIEAFDELNKKYGVLHWTNTAARKLVLNFILTQLTLAEKQAANDICKLIDDIELSYHGSSLEEWKAFKHIRNAIRDKYDPKSFQEDKNI